MNPCGVYSFPFSGSSFPNSGSLCLSNGSSYHSSGSSYPSSGSLYLDGGPPSQRIPTYHPNPGAPSRPINILWQTATQHWSQLGLTAPEPPGGHYFSLPGFPGSCAPPNAGGPGWIGHGQLGGSYYGTKVER